MVAGDASCSQEMRTWQDGLSAFAAAGDAPRGRASLLSAREEEGGSFKSPFPPSWGFCAKDLPRG